jgi:Zn-dependent protease with chaperone function
MNFFQAQDQARGKTRLLIFLFIAAVASLVVLTNLLAAMAMGFSLGPEALAAQPPQIWLLISTGVVGVIAIASLFKFLTLRGGGRVVAESLGGQPVRQNTESPQQRQLLNVVEEMAIAAGLPVPPVYLIPEPSINAFAAGYSQDDAVIGINQGTLDLLNRDELQGVVAHEFSHILNGDMRINIRLIALLSGILFIGMIGYGLLRGSAFSRSKDRGQQMALALGLIIVGYGGTFFGNLIKAAVSRQREFLADAAAVQFTRSNDGIANALKKIGGHATGSEIKAKTADESSHMFFGSIKSFSRLMATHPPLEDRIKALQPQWQGSLSDNGNGRAHQSTAGFAGTNASSTNHPDAVVNQIGQGRVEAATALLQSCNPRLANAAHDPYEARGLIYAMLIDKNAEIAQAQLDKIRTQAEPGVPGYTEQLLPLVQASNSSQLLLLLEVAMPTLKELSFQQYKRFSNNAAELIVFDQRVDIFEWVLHRVMTKELYAHFEQPHRAAGHIGSFRKLHRQVCSLLSAIAHRSPSAKNSYEAGAKRLNLTLPLSSLADFDYEQLNDALGQLRNLKPLQKQQLLEACAAVALADGQLHPDQHALLHGIAATLDCPLPLSSQPGAPT